MQSSRFFSLLFLSGIIFSTITWAAPPAVPVITSIGGDSSVPYTTNNTTPTIIGTADANIDVEVMIGAQLLTTTADGSGNWSVTPGSVMDNAILTVTARSINGLSEKSSLATGSVTIGTPVSGRVDRNFMANLGAGFDGPMNDGVLQDDGKTVIIGYFLQVGDFPAAGIVRLNSDGSIDQEFIDNVGSGFTTVGSSYPQMGNIELQSDGKIIVTIISNNTDSYNGVTFSGKILRLNTDGTRDMTFHTVGAGLVGGNFGNASFQNMHILSDDRIILNHSGGTYDGQAIPNGVMALTADGYVDTSFNNGNAGVNGPSGIPMLFRGPSNLYYLGFNDSLGSGYNGLYTDLMPQFWKIDFNGSLDTAHAVQMRANYDIPNYANITIPTGLSFVYPQDDGKIILFGYDDFGLNGGLGIARLNSDGTVDNTFTTTNTIGMPLGVVKTPDENLITISGTPVGQAIHKNAWKYTSEGVFVGDLGVTLTRDDSSHRIPIYNPDNNTLIINRVSVTGYANIRIVRLNYDVAETITDMDLQTASDTGISNSDNITTDTTPTLTGTAHKTSVLYFYDDPTPLDDITNATLLGTYDMSVLGLVSETGSWTYTPSALTEGTHNFKVIQKWGDIDSTASDESSALTVTIDLTGPGISGMTSIGGDTSAPYISNIVQPTIIGTGVAGLSISVTLDGQNYTTTVDGSGNWTVNATSSTLVDGNTYPIAINQTDLAGNVSSTSFNLTTDTSAPATAPVILSPTSGGYTNSSTPTLSGTADIAEYSHAYVEILDNASSHVGVATIDISGNWTYTLGSLSDAAYTYQARVVDYAGNIGPSTSVNFTVDTSNPAAPVITYPSAGAYINTLTPTLTGTGEINSTVSITVGGNTYTTTVVDDGGGNGIWSQAITLSAEGTTVAEMFATDSATNRIPVGLATISHSFIVDTISPAVPVLSTINTDISSPFTVNGALPTLSGTGEVDATITIIFTGTGSVSGTNNTVTTSVGPSGTWSVAPSTSLPDGSYDLTLSQTDLAGNVSITITPTPVLSIDTVAPIAPAITAPTAGTINTTNPTMSGTAEANSGITLYDTDGVTVLATTTADGSGNWSTGVILTVGSHTIVVRSIDAHENLSPVTNLSLTVDTGVPVLSSASVNGSTLTLTYSEPLDVASVPANGDYTVSESHSVTNVSVTGSTVVLTLSPAVTNGETITLSYTPGSNPVQDGVSNDAVLLSGQAVTNSTPSTSGGGGGGGGTSKNLIPEEKTSEPIVLTNDEVTPGVDQTQPSESEESTTLVNTFYGTEFFYEKDDKDIVKKLGISQEEYVNQCSTKKGSPYYRSCTRGVDFLSYQSVLDMILCEGIITKKDHGNYRPNDRAIRKEVVGVAVTMKRVDGLPVAMVSKEAYKNTYTDIGINVPGQAPWIAPVVETALKYGIISADRTKFEPENPVTRAEAYAMIMKSVCMIPSGDISLADSDTSWQENLYNVAYDQGLTSRPWEKFKPDTSILRQDLFTVAARAAEWAERTGGCDPKPEMCFLPKSGQPSNW